MSVTEPCWAPTRSAICVRGHRNPFAAKIAVSPATTPAAIAARLSERLVKPAQRRYAMQDSIENQARVWISLIAVSSARR
jgi:hypothetical protein